MKTTYKLGSNQYKKIMREFDEWRFLGLREIQWKSLTIVSLFILPTVYFGTQAKIAGHSAELVQHVKQYSPIPMDAYAMEDPTPSPIIETKIVYTTTPEEVKAAIKKVTPEKDWEATDKILSSESGYRPTVINSIGACGLGQALPCSKMKCVLNDITCQLNWFKSYISQRYQTVQNAWSFHQEKGWY